MKNILLVGVGRFGRHIAIQLAQMGHQVMAVDTSEDRINDVLPFVTNAQIGDSTNADFLRTLGIGNYDVCIVTISGNFQNSLETTSLLKELGAKCVFDYIEIDDQHAIFEVEVPEAWRGKNIGELDIRRRFGINILGIKRAGETDVSVKPETVLTNDVTILALGEYKQLQKCFRL